jgi:hypothetical protein
LNATTHIIERLTASAMHNKTATTNLSTNGILGNNAMAQQKDELE